MKTIFLIALAIALSFFAFSQTVIENPKVGMSTASNVKLKKIELRDTATVLWFHVNQTPGNWISIPKETYIQPVGANEKLFIMATDGIPMNEKYTMPASGEVNYKLIFPKIDASVSKVDFGEGNEGGSWFIYDIQLKPGLYKSILPEKLNGNWFRTDNAQWEISLFDSVAIYKSQVWKCLNYAVKDGLGKIKLKSGSKTLVIYAKAGDDSTCLIGEAPAKLVKYSNQPDQSVITADKEFFSLPVFKMDTVTYCGYFKDFNTRYQNRTGMIYVNDVLAGEQFSYLLKIADDGTFKVKFTHNNPQGVLVRHPFYNGTVFLEPGKTTFQLIDNGSKTNQALFMGDCARINTDLLKLKNINGFDYYQMLYKVLDFTPEQYKAWLKELQQKDFDLFAYNVQTYSLCSKAAQIKKMEMDYRYASIMMEYNSNIEAAYRKKNNIPQDQSTIPFKPAKPDSTYYSFLTNYLVNNPLAVLCPDYLYFIQKLLSLDILNGKPKGFWTSDYLNAWEKKGNKLSPQEKELSNQLKEIDTPEFKKLQDEFQFNYGEQENKFQQKYNDRIQSLYKEKKDTTVTYAMIEKYLIGQNVKFTDDENTLLQALKIRYDNPLVKKNREFYEEHKNQLNQFEDEHNELSVEAFQEYSRAERNKNLEKIAGVKPGFANAVMTSQFFCQAFMSEMIPISTEKLKSMQEEIANPFIANYMELKNNETKAKIEANKKLTGSKVNEVPKNIGDKVFDAIMAKYKGKIVYVDFWATWCAPCLSGIERIKPLKDEMANENVAFVYITNPSSPKATYDNMIPSIKGEHYRISDDQWEILHDMFKMSGIPHYVLVDKDGKVINPQLDHLENSQLKTLLMKYVNE